MRSKGLVGNIPMDRVQRPTLEANRRKIAECILLLIEEAEARGTYVTKYDIVKSFVVADVQHLNTYGRPVTFDNYYAMKDGPVPSAAYEMLGDAVDVAALHDVQGWPLWDKEPSPRDGLKAVRYIRPRRSANLRVLSQTDISALKDALSLIKAQSFSDTRDMTHEYKAYKEAWREDAEKKSFLMAYGLLLDMPDDDLVSDIMHASHYA